MIELTKNQVLVSQVFYGRKWIKFLESWLQLQHLLASHEEHDESYFIEMHCINGNLFHKDALCLSGPNSFHLLIFFIGSEAEELKCKKHVHIIWLSPQRIYQMVTLDSNVLLLFELIKIEEIFGMP